MRKVQKLQKGSVYRWLYIRAQPSMHSARRADLAIDGLGRL